jgi:hypothetical protein
MRRLRTRWRKLVELRWLLKQFHALHGHDSIAYQRFHAALRLNLFAADATPWVIERIGISSEIAALCDRHGSDKGEVSGANPYPWASHTYAELYEILFAPRRASVRTVLECGIGSTDPDIPSNMTVQGRPGASLRVWRDYFPNAQILGGDIDEASLFEEPRIRTGVVNQTDPSSIRRFLQQSGHPHFDVIIDDGLHTYQANVTFFEGTFPRLAEGGIYLIEDCDEQTTASFRRYFAERDLPVRIVSMFRPGQGPVKNNRVIIIEKPAALSASESAVESPRRSPLVE